MPPAEGQDHDEPLHAEPTGHAIIVGFGLSGRATANALIAHGVPLYVIERNADTVHRCAIAGLRIVEGDATDEQVLLRAGIESAVLFAVTMPNDSAMLETVALARRLNPMVRILARCEYVSTGMKATRRGADEVVVAEQVIAAEFGRLVHEGFEHKQLDTQAAADTPPSRGPEPAPAT